MRIEFTELAWEDFAFWLENDPEKAMRIKELLNDIAREPFKGIGKPEPLKFDLKGLWSRRINDEHRLVYRISGARGIDQQCTVLQCRFHYDR